MSEPLNIIVLCKKFIVGFCLLCSINSFAEELDVGDMAPNWLLNRVNDEAIFLWDEVEKGKTIVMVFWASWCHACEDLLPLVSRLKEQTEGKPIQYYALNVWEERDPETYLKSRNVNLDIIPKADAVAERFNVKGTPGVVVVGLDKRIKYIRSTRTSSKDVIQALETVLKL